MNEHTKEPWCVMGPCAQWETARIFSGARYIGSIGNSDETESETRANADRIISCVNACVGMKDPATDIATLKAQRDELLAAANGIEAWWRLPNIARTANTIEPPMRAIIEAVANAEAEARPCD